MWEKKDFYGIVAQAQDMVPFSIHQNKTACLSGILQAGNISF